MIASGRRDRRRWSAAAMMAAAAAAFVALSLGGTSSAVAAAQPPAPKVVMTPALQEKIQHLIEDFRKAHNLPGLSAAVITGDPSGSGSVVTTFAIGLKDLQPATAVDASTQFELGSETKVFTADLLSYLVATHAVSLDDPVQKYAPPGVTVPVWTDPQTGATTPITLRDLATHQAALPDVPPNFQDGCGDDPSCVNPHPGYSLTMLWDAVSQQTLLWQPGTRWLYSNFGFGLLGAILSNIVDPGPLTQPPNYQPAIDGTFLAALGMSSTMLEAPSTRLAVPYAPDGTPTYYWDNTNAISGAGGLISDATDMGTWAAANLGYVSPDAPLGVQTMSDTLQPVSAITTACQTPTDCAPADFQMGLGWQLYSATDAHVGAPWAFKNGGTAGSSSDTALAPSIGAGVTTMFNMDRVDNDQIAVPILALLVANQSTPTPSPSPTATAAGASPELADSGSDPVSAGLAAAALLVAGAALALRRRPETTHRSKRAGS